MKKETLFEVMGEIDEKYVAEARFDPNEQLETDQSQDGQTAPNEVEIESPKQPSEIEISREQISINDISEYWNSDSARYQPEKDQRVLWDADQIAEYYGTDLIPPYVLEQLKAAPHNGSVEAYISENGAVVEDTVTLDYYYSYFEDGSPQLVEMTGAPLGFTLTASKLGLMSDVVYEKLDGKVKSSDLAGTQVKLGRQKMPFGPYDPDRHEPAGYYDFYLAQFKMNGIAYEIAAQQLEEEEVIRIVASIITGEKEIVIVK